MNEQLVPALSQILGTELPAGISEDTLRALLAEKINQLIQQDFEKLVQVLYRVDVNEAKLKQLLKTHPQEDAGKLIAGLLVERQLQKIKSRSDVRPPTAGSDEEKW